MKTRLPLLLVLLLAVTPASAAAQASGSPSSEVTDPALIDQLCTAAAADDAERESCITSVEAALADLSEELPDAQQGLLDQAQALVDDTIESLRDVDLQGAFDELVAEAQDFQIDIDIDVQGAIDDAVAAFEDIELPSEVDIQAALDEAVAEALAATEDIDLQAAVDEALAEAQAAIEEADLQGVVDEAVVALEDSVEQARAVVAEAQRWAQENREAVCRGSSVSLGTTVGMAVFVLTGVEWLGLQAFWATERFTNGVCGDLAE